MADTKLIRLTDRDHRDRIDVVIPEKDFGYRVIVDRKAYVHALTDPDGTWVYAPLEQRG